MMPDDATNLSPPSLPRLGMSDAKISRLLFRRRGPLTLTIAGAETSLWYFGAAPAPSEKSGVNLTCHIGRQRGCLILPVPLIEHLLRIADRNLSLQTLGADLLPAVLLGLLAPALEAAEATYGSKFDIRPWRGALPASTPALLFQCQLQGRTYAFHLIPERALLESLTQLLSALPGFRQDLPELHAALIFSLGTAILPLRDIDRLKPGDVILPNAPPLAAGKACLVLADRWLAEAAFTTAELTLTTHLRDTRPSSMETDSMNTPTSDPRPDDISLGELPLRLTFEIGRADLPVDEIQSLAPGYVFALAREPGQSVDICVSGRRIGTGELVQIGEQLGVRLNRLGQHG